MAAAPSDPVSTAPLADLSQTHLFPTPPPRGPFVATVKENRHLCTDHYRLTLSLSHFAPSTPGQFVQIDCGDPHTSADHDSGPRSFCWPPEPHAHLTQSLSTDPEFNAPLPYLRRPFSIAQHRHWADGYTEISILHRVIGKGTLQLAQLRPGQKVSVIGPLGKGFHLPTAIEHACLVGGGVGIPPMFYLAETLARETNRHVTAFVGAQRHDLLPLTFVNEVLPSSPEGDPVLNVEEFCEFEYPTAITTDDGSMGMKGYVTDALRRFLQKRLETNGHVNGVLVFCCGPTPMMKATARVAAAFNVPCQVSLEQPMACGMGTCQSCIVRHKPHEPVPGTGEPEWKYKLTCTDGPVFDSRDLMW